MQGFSLVLGDSGPEALTSPWQRFEGKSSLQDSLLRGRAVGELCPTDVLHWDLGPVPECWRGAVLGEGRVPGRQTYKNTFQRGLQRGQERESREPSCMTSCLRGP